MQIVPKAGHLMHIESAQDVAKRLLSFLAGR
jgi:pimeloyl-ACP methyl ester carboxylesterase